MTPPPYQNLDVPKDVYKPLMVQMPKFKGTRIEMPWNLYTPDQAMDNPEELFPLVVSLHGGYGREVAEGNILVDGAPFLLGASTGLLTPANREKYPSYIVMPHCVQSANCNFYSNEWSSNGGPFFTVKPQPSDYGSALIELIEHIIDTYNVDPARIYVTGASMGGGGTWELAQRRPDLVAAAFPMAGHTPALQYLDSLVDSKVPVWAFSSTTDNNNPAADTDSAVKYISDKGGCAWVTKFNGIAHGHLLWQRAFLEPGLWDWVFAQRQPRAGDAE